MTTAIKSVTQAVIHPTFFDKLSPNTICLIFQSLDFRSYLGARGVCHQWNIIANDPEITYSGYVQDKLKVPDCASLSPRVSDWKLLPRVWNLGAEPMSLQRFSSLPPEIIAFHPRFNSQPAKIFSFTHPIPVFDQNFLLGRWGDIYFMTPLEENLTPLGSYTLIALDIKEPLSPRKFLLSRDLTAVPEKDLKNYVIKSGFPLAKDKIVIQLKNGDLYFWNLAPPTPVCYKILSLKNWKEVDRVGDHLIYGSSYMVDLNNPSTTKPSPARGHCMIFGSFICKQVFDRVSKAPRDTLELFKLNDDGLVEQKWSRCPKDLIEGCRSFRLVGFNENFIIVRISAKIRGEKKSYLAIFNIEGTLVYNPFRQLEGAPALISLFDHSEISTYLSGNVLLYKWKRQNILYFWHIPTQKCIQKLDLTPFLTDHPLSYNSVRFEDLTLIDRKLTILLSSKKEPVGDQEPRLQFRIVQFDPGYKGPTS